MLPFHLIIAGIQGSGKGTQSVLLSEHYKMPCIGVGDLIRNASKGNSVLANKVREIHNKGLLLPNKLVKEIVEKEVGKFPKGQTIIFEGYPRDMDQVKDFEDILKKRDIQKKKMIVITIKDKTVYQRLSGRRVCVSCGKIYMPPKSYQLNFCESCGGRLIKREDDNEEAIKRRLQVYREKTQPLIDYIRKQGDLVVINGEQTIPEVFKEIIKKLGEVFD